MYADGGAHNVLWTLALRRPERSGDRTHVPVTRQPHAILDEKKLVVVQTQVKSQMYDLLKKFTYYRLPLYTFALSSMLEIMLGGNFKEEYIVGIKEEIENCAAAYRDAFGRCSVRLEKMSKRI